MGRGGELEGEGKSEQQPSPRLALFVQPQPAPRSKLANRAELGSVLPPELPGISVQKVGRISHGRPSGVHRGVPSRQPSSADSSFAGRLVLRTESRSVGWYIAG